MRAIQDADQSDANRSTSSETSPTWRCVDLPIIPHAKKLTCLIGRLSCAVAFWGLGSAQAASVDASGASNCTVRAFATDHDPGGSNIRSAPRADAPIIGRLPPLSPVTSSDSVGAVFEVIGSKDGWLLIQNPEAAQYEAKAAQPFSGPGWISGGLVGVSLGENVLHSAPRRDAPAVAKLLDSGKGWGPDFFQVIRVHACLDDFVEVTATSPAGTKVRGWSRHPCSSQLTACDRGSE